MNRANLRGLPNIYLDSFKPFDFERNFVWGEDNEALIAELRRLNVLHVVAGSEVAVTVADIIADRLKVSTANDILLSGARRDKYQMHEALKARGLAHIRHLKTKNFEEVLAWKLANGFSYPIVIKPLASGGTDNVTICFSESQAREAFERVLASLDVECRPNLEVLVQEYIEGDEYVINTVSSDRKHYVEGGLKVNKKITAGGAPIYDYAELLSPREHAEIYQVLTEYIKLVLDAVGIFHGPGHAELMLKKDGKVVLIEIAARPIGGINPSAYLAAQGYSHLSMAVRSYVLPESLPRILLPEIHADLKQRLICLFMISQSAGAILREPDCKTIEGLPCYHSLVVQTAGALVETTNLLNCPGFVNLVASDRNELMLDYESIRATEEVFFRKMILPVQPDASLANIVALFSGGDKNIEKVVAWHPDDLPGCG